MSAVKFFFRKRQSGFREVLGNAWGTNTAQGLGQIQRRSRRKG